MADCHSIIEEEEIFKLLIYINNCSNYLAMYKNREGLSARKRAELVKVQMEKARLIAKLKTLVRNMTVIPEGVKKIYF